MKCGEIYYATLDPSLGSETAKCCPILIVSNNSNNRVGTTVTILPITSNVTKVYPFEILLQLSDSGLSKLSKVQAQQIKTIAKQCINGSIRGSLKESLMQLVDTAIKLHLSL